MRFRKVILIALVILSLTVPVFAQNSSFGLRPEDQTIGYFRYTLEPGESLEDALLALNGTGEDMFLNVSVEAGHTALTGGLTFEGEPGGASEWITLPNEGIIEIPSEMQLRMPFSLTVPEDTLPGEYVAGFLAAPVEEAEAEGSGAVRVKVISRMGLTMVIHVPGESYREVVVNSIDDEVVLGEWKITLNMSNLGNVHFKGTGHLSLVDHADSQVKLERDFPIGYYVAGEDLNYPLYFPLPPTPGTYELMVTIKSEEGDFETTYFQTVEITEEKEEQALEEAQRVIQSEQPIDPFDRGSSSSVAAYQMLGYTLLGLAAILLIVIIVLAVMTLKSHQQDRPVVLRERLSGSFPAEHRNQS
jgi:hypothetical protein